MRFLPLVFVLVGALLAGCSTTLLRDEPKVLSVGTRNTPCAGAPLAAALLTQRGTVVKYLTGTWKDRIFAAECVTQGEEGRFTAIFLAPHMRLATLVITPPHTLSFDRVKQIPATFEPEYLLFDLAVINLPLGTLRTALGPKYTVTEENGTRTVVAQGEKLAQCTPLANGACRYENFPLVYTYVLTGEKPQ